MLANCEDDTKGLLQLLKVPSSASIMASPHFIPGETLALLLIRFHNVPLAIYIILLSVGC